jgi:hypothetical protein
LARWSRANKQRKFRLKDLYAGARATPKAQYRLVALFIKWASDRHDSTKVRPAVSLSSPLPSVSSPLRSASRESSSG